MRAYRSNDLPLAVRLAGEATAAWPSQPYYILGLASIAARAGDTAAVRRALSHYADLGLGADLAADEDFAAIRDVPALAPVRARLLGNVAPMVRSRPAFRLGEPDFFPEGIACSASRGMCYVASVRHRMVAAVGRDAVERILADSTSGLLGAMALGLSADGRTLWVSSIALPQTIGFGGSPAMRAGAAALHAIDTRAGAVRRRLFFPADSIPANPGDLYVARNGDVFVSDSRRGVIYRVPPAGDTVVVHARDPLLRSPQGLAESADGRLIYVADYSHGIIAVDRASGQARAVAAPHGATTLGIDGLVRIGHALIGVQNGVQPARVVRLTIGADPLVLTRLDVLDRNVPLANGPTSGSVMGREYRYVANSLWESYDDEGKLKPGAAVAAPIVLSLPLP